MIKRSVTKWTSSVEKKIDMQWNEEKRIDLSWWWFLPWGWNWWPRVRGVAACVCCGSSGRSRGSSACAASASDAPLPRAGSRAASVRSFHRYNIWYFFSPKKFSRQCPLLPCSSTQATNESISFLERSHFFALMCWSMFFRFIFWIVFHL